MSLVIGILNRIIGTTSSTFKIDEPNNGPTLGNESGDLTVNGQLVSGALRESNKATLAFNTSSPLSLLTLPIGYGIKSILVNVTTPFNGTTPTLSIGISGTTDKYVATSDLDLTVMGAFPLELASNSATVQESVIGTFSSGSSTAGTAEITITYGKMS